MRRHRPLLSLSIVVAALLAAPATVAPAVAATPTPIRPMTPAQLKAEVLARAHAARPMATAANVDSFGNGIFQVFLEQASGLGIGAFTVETGADNPAGPGRNVLFGNGVPGTSFLTVRDLTTGQDFVESPYLTQATEETLDGWNPQVTTTSPTSRRVGWDIPTKGGSAEVHQDIVVHGSTMADSSVEVTTSIDGSGDTFQVQYLWDLELGQDDGPVVQTLPADGQYRPFANATTAESTFVGANSLAAADAYRNPGAPTMAIGLTGSGPSRVTPAATPPASVKYVCWPRAVGAAPGSYETDPTIDVSTPDASCTESGSGPDSAVEYLFPPASDTTGVHVTASLFATPTVPDATSITVNPVSLGSPSLSATLTDTGYDRPVPGRTLTFSAGSGQLCSAVTDANGLAACGGTAEGLAALLGYSASYAGGAIWAASEGQR